MAAVVEIKSLQFGVRGLAPGHSSELQKRRYVDSASQIDITECHSRHRWLQNYDIPCSPLRFDEPKHIQKFYIYSDVTHTHPAAAGSFSGRIAPVSNLWYQRSDSRSVITWVCVKTPGPRWICGSLLFNRVLNGGIEQEVLNGGITGGIERRAFPKQTLGGTGACVCETVRIKGFILVLLKHLQGV